MNIAQESGIHPDSIRPRQQTQNVETNVAFSGSFGVGKAGSAIVSVNQLHEEEVKEVS